VVMGAFVVEMYYLRVVDLAHLYILSVLLPFFGFDAGGLFFWLLVLFPASGTRRLRPVHILLHHRKFI